MNVIVVGLNHETAPVDIREQFTVSESDLPRVLVDLQQRKSILECVVLSTCNRTEIYAVVDKLERTKHYIYGFMEDTFSVTREQFIPYLYVHEEREAVKHLFRVTSGLDSMIIGETQILGQVKQAFFTAQQVGTTGTWFNKLFKEAITVAKRAHRETAIAEHPVSIAYAAVEWAKQQLGTLANKRALVIGAGKMSALSIKHLQASGIKEMYIVNRTFERASRLASQLGGQAYAIEHLPSLLHQVDLVISSTGAPNYMITEQMVRNTLEKQKRRLTLLDIALPRDIEPSVAQLDGVTLYNLDDLKQLLDQSWEQRKREAQTIERRIEQEIEQFYNWLSLLGVVPIIQALQTKAKHIYETTMASLYQKLPELSDRERKVIGKLTKSMLNQLLRDPILQIKELSAAPDGEEALQYFIRFFALEQERVQSGETQPVQEQVAIHS